MAGSLDYKRLGKGMFVVSSRAAALLTRSAQDIARSFKCCFAQYHLEQATISETAATKQQPSACSFLYESCEYWRQEAAGLMGTARCTINRSHGTREGKSLN